MSDFKMREGSFCLFPNDKKGNDKAPAYKGDGLLNGRAHEAAIWVREGARGEYFSMVVKEKQQHRDKPIAKPKQEELPIKGDGPAPEDSDSSVPF